MPRDAMSVFELPDSLALLGRCHILKICATVSFLHRHSLVETAQDDGGPKFLEFIKRDLKEVHIRYCSL